MSPLTLDEILRAISGTPQAPTRSCRVSGVSIDSRAVTQGELFFAIRGQRFDGHDFVEQALDRGALFAVVSRIPPGVSGRDRLIVVEDTTRALGKLAAFYRSQLPAAVVGVTGSNGKTTTKAMIAHVLSARHRGQSAPRSYNNDIGVPLTLLSAGFADDFVVVEIGSNAPGEVAHLAKMARPDVAVVTSVGPAHLQGLGDLRGVIREKLSILAHLSRRGVGVVNTDEPLVRDYLEATPGPDLIRFGTHPDADLRLSSVRSAGGGLIATLNDRFEMCLSIPGRHNAMNALAACAVGLRLGYSREDILQRLPSFSLPEMRLQVDRHGTFTVINDCYNANPASMRAAIEVLQDLKVPGRRVAVIGDMFELGPQATALHQELGRLIARSDIDVLVSVGEFSRTVCDASTPSKRALERHTARSVEELCARLPELLRPQDTVLLKGSRALQMERLLPTLAASPAPT